MNAPCNDHEWQALVDAAPDIVIVLEQDDRISHANACARHAYGYCLDEFRQLSLVDLSRSHTPLEATAAGTRVDPSAVIQATHYRRDGQPLDLDVTVGEPGKGRPKRRLLIARPRADAPSVDWMASLYASVFEASPEAILVTDADQSILSVNRAFSCITGYGESEVVGRRPSVLSSGRHDASFYQRMWEKLHVDGHWQGEIWNRRKNGEIYPQWQTITIVRDPRGRIANYVAVFADITERKSAEAHISHLAYHDPLTSLPNRLLLSDRLDQALRGADRAGKRVGVLVIDLDHFKAINDRFGHSAGDALLQDVARRLAAAIRDSDTVSRVGGDEFVVVLPGLNHAVEARLVGEKMLTLLAPAFEIAHASVPISASIGVSVYPDDGVRMEDLLEHADAAMYQSKMTGRNAVRMYSEAGTSSSAR